MSQVNSGVGQLEGMRERHKRQPPQNHQPKREVSEVTLVEQVVSLEDPVVERAMPKQTQAIALSSADTSTTVQVTAYITAEALTAVRLLRGPKAPGGYVALQAISTAKERLSDLLNQRRSGQIRRSVDDFMFPPRSGAAAGKGEARRMWVIRLTPAELAVVDSLAAHLGASRSELISVAVEAYVSAGTPSTEKP